jgi:ATP-dependent DNA helicase DinG
MDVSHLLGPTGPVAARLPVYEDRPQQTRMAQAVDETMRMGGVLLAEAGTGVGKSFAYLVPAVAAAAERGERVVIATHTIALQEQLLGKDVPFLSGVMPAEFSVVLAKGRGNFLCQRRMHMADASGRELFDTGSQVSQLARIVEWSERTSEGSRQDLDFAPDNVVWNRVNAEAGNCLGRSCDYFDKCFYQAGKRRLQNANIIVANHHFLFADMALRRAGWQLLPEFQHLVLDEAHAVEDVASEYLGMRVARGQVHYILRQLASPNGKGLLNTLGDSYDAVLAISAVAEARDAADAFFDDVRRWHDAGEPSNHRLRTPDLFHLDLADKLEQVGRGVRVLAEAEDGKEKALELHARSERCLGLAEETRSLVRMDREDHVYWVEEDGEERKSIALRSAPVDVASDLHAHLWSKLKSATLTSATLSAGGEDGFAHLASRLGVREPSTLLVGSPFRYDVQARLICDSTLPDPRDGEAFETALPDAVLRHVRRTRGHAFVLFTSYSSLDRCHAACAGALRNDDHLVLKQGEGLPRGRMLEEFRKAPSAVLFGTDSFWEGVDVPGDALQNVIITRLPFAVPTHPLQEARTQAIRDRGGDAFAEYSLPQAILKFKQGFGRLIRTATDRGIVVCLDRRLVKMRYGRQFIAALPDVPVEVV